MISKRSTQHHTPDPKRVYRNLKRWFDRNARAMPWRGETDPYRVWVSEIMLVQTTGAVVTKRYPRFLRRFPTVHKLASSRIDAVMKEWEGLGYYNRARYLHRAAQIIVRDHDGIIPSDYATIRALPGIGDYVAAAVANFCFGTRIPPVDANVARMGARFFGIAGDVRSGKVRSQITARLQELMTVGRGSLWTDGLIEIGATVCMPRSPRCESCPLAADCRAFTDGDAHALGLPAKKAQAKEVAVACGIIRRADGRILITQRHEGGLLPLLWEFPGGKRHGNERLAGTCRREIKEELGISVTVGQRVMLVRHAYTHFRVRLSVFDCQYRSGTPQALGCRQFRWVRPRDLGRYAFPSADRQIIAALQSS
ncbi:MAG TPA: A/G-specific adenine glycosylase [candidate division Zixibacteria bacterium]|nr:A/G-specific adenine glycosylase [candidate division Zixibacteria bacterium]